MIVRTYNSTPSRDSSCDNIGAVPYRGTEKPCFTPCGKARQPQEGFEGRRKVGGEEGESATGEGA